MKSKDYASLYTQLGRLLEVAPSTTDTIAFRTPEGLQWLGRAHALVVEAGVSIGMDAVSFTSATRSLKDGAYGNGLAEIFQILYRALAHCELRAPASLSGAFIAVGNSFDAYAALSKIFRLVKRDVMIVDPYMDETALTDFGVAVNDGVNLRLLADEAACKATFAPAAKRWVAQHGASRPVEARVSAPKTLHDRAIFVDGDKAWTLTQSLKDFAKRSPAEIVRADDTASLKIEAYELLWAGARTVI